MVWRVWCNWGRLDGYEGWDRIVVMRWNSDNINIV